MSVQFREVGVVADLTVEVSRDAGGDLTDGVRSTLARIDDVRTVDDVEVTGLTPRLNDLRADVRADLTLAVEDPDPDAARTVLEDGFGVSVDGVAFDPPP